jgi:SAM-dependent methyltransferase
MTTTHGIEYTLPNAWDQAGRRLELLAACYDPGTFRRLHTLGVGPGWNCLEVGAGIGSVAGWLSRRVGPVGSVTATDLDTRFLEALELPNVTVLHHDVTGDPLPEAAFDLVHARAVLCHLPEREALVAKLAACVRPDGWLLLEEADTYGTAGLADGAVGEAWWWASEMVRAAGGDLAWPRHLPADMAAAGLVDISAEIDARLFRGGSPEAEMAQLTFIQLDEAFQAAGAQPWLVEEAVTVLADPDRWFPSFHVVAVRGRRPA